jgi:hypothetical protein
MAAVVDPGVALDVASFLIIFILLSSLVSIAQQPQNGGKACPTGETRNCVPSICYDITSEDSSFKSINNVKAIETLPPNHPSKNRNDCGGPPIGLPKSSPCGLTESQLFYAFDSSTSKSLSTMDTPGKNKKSRES